MKTSRPSSGPGGARTYLFGSFYPRVVRERPTASLGVNLPRLAVVSLTALFLVYLFAAGAGFLWLHYVRGVGQISFWDVAQFRWKSVRRDIAVQQFAKAEVEWDARNYQAAYLQFASGLRNDPDNVPGRLAAAGFFEAVGAPNQEATLLEDGLARSPDDQRLIVRTFDVLTATGRDRRSLDLLHRSLAAKLSGPNGALLRTYEVQAMLNAEGAAPAKALLEKYPDLSKNPASAPVVAQVLWQTRDRLAAIELLSAYLQAHPDARAAYAQLAEWQAAGGMADDARQTAERACARFPQEPLPRILLIDMLAASRGTGSREWQQTVATYLRDFGGRPEVLLLLADLAGRMGWTNLARALYVAGATRQQNLAVLALFYSDALAHASRLSEAQDVLAQVEAQSSEGSPAFLVLLRQRQVTVAAARGDHEAARAAARRLATILGSDPDGMAGNRRRFAQLGIAEAVEELTPGGLAARGPGRK